MKKTLIVLPLAFLLVNCSTSRNTTTGANASSDASLSSSTNVPAAADQAAANASGTIGTDMASTSTMGTTSTGSTSGNTLAGATMTSDAYHTDNMLTSGTGNVYNGYNTRAADLAASGTGGRTYNMDMRRNTSYNNAVDGEWTLMMTPEVSTAWLPDRSRPEDYASYWTADAIRARQQTYVSAAATMDTRNKGKNTGKKTKASSAKATTSASVNASANMGNNSTVSGMNATTNMNGSVGVSGSTGTTSGSTNFNMNEAQGFHSNNNTTTLNGSTNNATNMNGSMGMNATGTMNMGANSGTSNMYTAVNGNPFMMPRLNLYIENGSFTGYTGCNQVMGNVLVSENTLKFQTATPATAIECAGGFDQNAFLEKIRRVDNYEIVNNELRLRSGNETLMVLSRNNSMNNATSRR